MKTTMRFLAAAVGGLVAFGPAWPVRADDPSPYEAPSGTETKASKDMDQPGQTTTADTNKSSFWTKLSDMAAPAPEFEAARAKALIGKTVRGSDNAKLGTFENCLIDLPQGRIAVCLIGSGGVLGIGETLRAVPSASVSYDESRTSLAMATDRQTFRLAPAFSLKNVDDATQLAAAYRQFGQEPYWTEGTRQPVREAENAAEHAAPGAAPSNLKKATQIIGFTVRDTSREEIGVIHDFVLDLKSGRVLYAVLAQGGILGVGDKLYPIPPQSLSFVEGEKALTLNMARAQLDRAPQFTRATWPALNDPKWASDVYSFYHAPMYWLGPHPELGKGATDLMRQPVREPEVTKENTPESVLAGSAYIAKIKDALKADTSLESVADRIQVSEKDRVVTLSGMVDTDAQKEAAAKAAKVEGVKEVVNNITVQK